jgi:hypothetical protein
MQRGGRSSIDSVTVVMRFLRTTMSHSASFPPVMSAASLVVPTFWRRTAVPFLSGSSLTESR